MSCLFPLNIICDHNCYCSVQEYYCNIFPSIFCPVFFHLIMFCTRDLPCYEYQGAEGLIVFYIPPSTCNNAQHMSWNNKVKKK
jgi:hypothetical protein